MIGRKPKETMKGAGGTQGGVGQFFVGLLMAVGGAYLLTNQVSVSSGFWAWFGPRTFGLTLLPLVFGIGLLFFDGASRVGWLLTAAGGRHHPAGHPDEPQDLLRAHQPVQYPDDARPARGRARSGRSLPETLRL